MERGIYNKCLQHRRLGDGLPVVTEQLQGEVETPNGGGNDGAEFKRLTFVPRRVVDRDPDSRRPPLSLPPLHRPPAIPHNIHRAIECPSIFCMSVIEGTSVILLIFSSLF